MPASNLFDTRLSQRIKHRPSNTRTKEMFYVFDRMFGPSGPGQTRNVCQPNTIKHFLVNKHFTVWTPSLVLFDRVWSNLIVFGRVWYNLKAIKHSIKNLNYFFCSRVWWAMFCSFGQPRIKHVWSGHAYHACSAACINCLICVWSNMC